MSKRKIRVIEPEGFKDGYNFFANGDEVTIDGDKARYFVSNGWAEFIDGGEDVERVEQPTDVKLNVDNSTHNNSANFK